METKRFIGNDMMRLYEKVRRAFGPDAVIVRTRTLLREGAEPLIEILAAPPQGGEELALDLQWTMVDGALGRLQIARPRATVGDLEDYVAREAIAPPRLAGPEDPAHLHDASPEWMEGVVPGAPLAQAFARSGTMEAQAAEPRIVRRRPAFPSAESLPEPEPAPSGDWAARPRPTVGRPTEAPAAGLSGRRPAEGGIGRTLHDAGLSTAAVQTVRRLAPGISDAHEALTTALQALDVRFPDEERRAVITIQGAEGSGRTTALLRMALDCADSGRPTVLVAADGSRAAAREQVLHYGEATGLATYDCADAAEIVQAVMQAAPGTCVFADVPAGRFDLPTMLGVAHHAYLSLPVHWQGRALQQTLAGLPVGSFSGCVLTHADLSTEHSPAVSLALEAGLGIAFLSSGRDISGGIDVADAGSIASGILPITTGVSADGRLVASA